MAPADTGHARLSLVGAPTTPPAERDIAWSICMARAQAGDGAAYHRLLTEITPFLRQLVRRGQSATPDIDDVVQDILLTLHSIRQTYDPARPFTPWLVAIAQRRLVDRLRRQGRIARREQPIEDRHATLPDPAADRAEAAAEARALHDAISRLPDGQRTAITLLKLQQRSLAEAAASTRQSQTALKVATHRALKALRAYLGGTDPRP